MSKIDNISDPIYNDVRDAVVKLTIVSQSILQHKFKIGYMRSNRLLKQLIENGVIFGSSNFMGQHMIINK